MQRYKKTNRLPPRRVCLKFFVVLGAFLASFLAREYTGRAISDEYLEAEAAAARVILDDFDNGVIDASLWDLYDPWSILYEAEGLLQADGPPSGAYAHLYLKENIFGEYVVCYMNFQDYFSDADLISENTPQVGLEIYAIRETDSDPESFVYIFRGGSEVLGSYFTTNAKIEGQWLNGRSAEARNDLGELMIVRLQQWIMTWYRDGSGPWHILGLFPFPRSVPVGLQITVYTGDNGLFHAGVDKVLVMSR